ncbi:hypothetical protein B0H10DRAFT_1886594 [Mycena sp. CBHHK59/15]|nr:hypothetical protein B0H10DRAFT_1886594 [Mycena sp. CBHHK59/15]
MPTVQISKFPVSEAFVNGSESFKGPLDLLQSADGHVSSFYGTQVEDAKNAYFITVWDSFEHHNKLPGDPNFPNILEGLKQAAAGKPERNQFQVAAGVDPNTALSAPATELVIFTLKADGSAEKLVPLLEELAKGLDKAVGAHPPCLWGASIETSGNFVLVVGWDTGGGSLGGGQGRHRPAPDYRFHQRSSRDWDRPCSSHQAQVLKQ